MVPHPDFANMAIPRTAVVGGFHLSPLTAEEVDEDYAAIRASEPVLRGLFGDEWPSDVTPELNLVDLCWHDREFSARRSFSWIIRENDGRYAGCAYLFPEIGTRGKGEIVSWMCDTPDRVARLARFNDAFRSWIAAFLPVAYEVKLTTNGAGFEPLPQAL